MKYAIRMLLQVYSPSGLAMGTTRELALCYFAVRMASRFRFYRWLIGPPSDDMLAHFAVGSLTRGSLRHMTQPLTRPPNLN